MGGGGGSGGSSSTNASGSSYAASFSLGGAAAAGGGGGDVTVGSTGSLQTTGFRPRASSPSRSAAAGGLGGSSSSTASSGGQAAISMSLGGSGGNGGDGGTVTVNPGSPPLSTPWAPMPRASLPNRWVAVVVRAIQQRGRQRAGGAQFRRHLFQRHRQPVGLGKRFQHCFGGRRKRRQARRAIRKRGGYSLAMSLGGSGGIAGDGNSVTVNNTYGIFTGFNLSGADGRRRVRRPVPGHLRPIRGRRRRQWRSEYHQQLGGRI